MIKTKFKNLYEGHDFEWDKQLNHLDKDWAFDEGDLNRIFAALSMQQYVPDRIIKHLIDVYPLEDNKPSKHEDYEWLYIRYCRCKLDKPTWGPTKIFNRCIEPLIQKEGLHDKDYSVDKLRYAIKKYDA